MSLVRQSLGLGRIELLLRDKLLLLLLLWKVSRHMVVTLTSPWGGVTTVISTGGKSPGVAEAQTGKR